MDKPDINEFKTISEEMEVFHGIFSQLWRMGRPSFSTRIKTACVGFDKEGNYVSFLFNPDFWKECSITKKKFVIAHESLHVLLSHGKRMQGKNKDVANKAADVVINEGLIEQFGFDRSEIDPENKYCWLDTVFSEEDNVEPNKCFEYYYDKLLKKTKEQGKNGKPQAGGSGSSGKCETVDEHDDLDSFSEETCKAIASEINDNLSEEEIQSVSERLQEIEQEQGEGKKEGGKFAGSLAGSIVKEMKVRKVPKKRKWEIVIKKWARKYLINTHKDNEQWAMLNRRLNMLPCELFLPSDYEMEDREKEEHRIEVWFFQDTSGSCAHLAERFFKAALSLPEDRFDVKMHCFDTKVYPVDLKNPKVQGFGGTSFEVLESYIQNSIKSGKTSRYPDAVFVVTDGAGDMVKPEQPKKWFWFLSEDIKYYIPKESNTYNLKDFE